MKGTWVSGSLLTSTHEAFIHMDSLESTIIKICIYCFCKIMQSKEIRRFVYYLFLTEGHFFCSKSLFLLNCLPADRSGNLSESSLARKLILIDAKSLCNKGLKEKTM